MNLDEMKAAWQEYDTKLQSTQVLNEKLINSLIKERSFSRLSRVRRQYGFLLFFLLFWVLFDIAVLAGNPFDFKQFIEYIPIGIRCLCMIVLALAMLKFNIDLRKIELSHDSLYSSLNKIIKVVGSYENPDRLIGWALKLMLLSSAVLFPLSFLPRKIERTGLWEGIGDTLIPIAIALSLIFIANKLGAFKGRNEEKFREDLKELDELKNLSEEIAGS